MFANLDYPVADAGVPRDRRRARPTQLLDALAGRPSLAVLCGNSEVEQQVAMLGLDPALGRGELFGELLPRLVARARVRRRLRALGAVRRRAAVPTRPRRRQLLRRRRLPAAARGRAARRGPLRGRVPRASPTCPTRRRSRRCCPSAGASSSCTIRAGRPACRATSAPAGTSTTCATTTCELLFGVDAGELRRDRPRALPRALARGHAAR